MDFRLTGVSSTNAQTDRCSSTILLDFDFDYDSTMTDEKMHSEKIELGIHEAFFLIEEMMMMMMMMMCCCFCC